MTTESKATVFGTEQQTALRAAYWAAVDRRKAAFRAWWLAGEASIQEENMRVSLYRQEAATTTYQLVEASIAGAWEVSCNRVEGILDAPAYVEARAELDAALDAERDALHAMGDAIGERWMQEGASLSPLRHYEWVAELGAALVGSE